MPQEFNINYNIPKSNLSIDNTYNIPFGGSCSIPTNKSEISTQKYIDELCILEQNQQKLKEIIVNSTNDFKLFYTRRTLEVVQDAILNIRNKLSQ